MQKNLNNFNHFNFLNPDLPENPVILFPIRHHSPVCSYHLRRMIRAYQPEVILIEGAENANDLIPVLTDEATKLPVAIYYFYKDKKKYVSEEAEDYHCYYPFLYASPEYQALKQAKLLGIPAKFIDLPYSEILIHTSAEKGLRTEQEQHNYADDSRLVRSRFYEKLCEKTGLRDFEEFWEKYFEIAGLYQTTPEFLHQMYTYCSLTRQDSTEEERRADGCTAREQHMAYRIQEAMQEYQKILVVTGGFHTPGLAELLNLDNSKKISKIKPVKLHKFSGDVQNCYPIAYSYESADALRGYASGMMHPGFYDAISQDLENSEINNLNYKLNHLNIYQNHALTLIAETAKACTKKDIMLSIADMTSAFSLTENLASLRNSPEPGIFEVYDGVTGAFIKGEKTLASSIPLDLLARIATGTGIGHIGDSEHIPPLIADFENQCKKFRLKSDTVVPQDCEISLFTSEKDLEKSRFFHRMKFLDTEFCERLKGTDFHHHHETNRSRVRELWRYCRSPRTDASLVDHTTDGATLPTACHTVAVRRIRNHHRCDVVAGICVDCFLMGITLSAQDYQFIQEILTDDGDFFSLGKGLYYFDMLGQLQDLYHFADPGNLQYLAQCYSKLIALLPSMGAVQSEQAEDCIQVCKSLYSVACRIFPERQEEFRSALITLTQRDQKEPSVYGAVMGLLYAMDSACLEQAETAMQGYLNGTAGLKQQGALYLRGLFGTARDIALTDRKFLEMADALLAGMDYPEFMEILPNLRFAFRYFTPSEIQQIAGQVAGLHNQNNHNNQDNQNINHKLSGEDLLHVRGIDEDLAGFGSELDTEICKILRKYHKNFNLKNTGGDASC